MNKADLINEVASVISNKKEAQEAVDCVFESIVNTLKKGDVVTLVGFGTFKVAKRKARTGHKPHRPAQRSKSTPPTPPSLCRAKLSRMPLISLSRPITR